MKRGRLAFWILGCVAVASGADSPVASDEVLAVDLTPVIQIGDFTVSRYSFQKTCQQFITSSVRRTGQKPGPSEMEHWFRLYLSQQVIKADLVERKQLARPEVEETTERMARYMLTQPNGPLYRELGGADPVAFRRERRRRILQECRFAAFPGQIAQLWAAISPAFARRVMPREADVEKIGTSIVARYTFRDIAREISAMAYVQDFQRSIARAGPRDVQSLTIGIEDIVVAEYDLAEARALRLDQTQQFLEDRRNFALNQALVLYESEVLARQLRGSVDEPAIHPPANLDLQRPGLPTLDRAAGDVQRKAMREKMDAIELEYLAQHFARVRIHLDPASYGIPTGTVPQR